MKKLLAVAALGEAATGVALLVYTAIVLRLLLGADVLGVGVVISRIAGISLISLGVACWPGHSTSQALCGLLTYNTLAMLYLAYLRLGGEFAGVLLWPAIFAHLILTILLAWAWVRRPRVANTKTTQ